MIETVAVVVLLGAAPAATSDWPQWRGAGRDAVSTGAGLPEWPGRLSRRWRTEVRTGQSSPVVSEGTVFLFTPEARRRSLHAPDPNDRRPGASYGAGR